LNTTAAVGDGTLCLSTTFEVKSATGSCGVSSLRFKHDISNLNEGLDAIAKLRPVSFELNGTDEPRIGLIAEEVERVDPRLVFYESDGTTVRGVRYEELGALLLKGIQELATTTDFISSN